uniref:J domain-containing protein n=1 Tax=Sulfuriferula sp. GW6 TaxID=3345112 RepID=UPI0039F6E4F4
MNHYEVLQVSRDASLEVIRAAYRTLVQRAHPDRAGSDTIHQERLQQINRAYGVLSDPGCRAEYDATLSNSGPPMIGGAGPPLLANPARGIPGADFSVTWQPGVVIGNEAWSDSHVQSKGGGGFVFMGFGMTSAPKVSSTVTARQRIALRLAAGDVFLEQTGAHLNVTTGQRVVLISVSAAKLRENLPVVLWNLNTGEWFWLSVGWEATGAKLRPRLAAVRDFALYAACVVGGAWVGWHFVRPMNLLVWALYFVFGVPLMIGLFTPVLFWTETKINNAVRRRVTALIDRLKATGEINGRYN